MTPAEAILRSIRCTSSTDPSLETQFVSAGSASSTRCFGRSKERASLSFPIATDSNIVVGHGCDRTKFMMSEEGTAPMRATTAGRTKLTGRLSCRIEAKLPAGIQRRWTDELGDALETRIPNILASFRGVGRASKASDAIFVSRVTDIGSEVFRRYGKRR